MNMVCMLSWSPWILLGNVYDLAGLYHAIDETEVCSNFGYILNSDRLNDHISPMHRKCSLIYRP
jgi:hypothetical protein